MTNLLLVGTDPALLEGLSQSLAALGYGTRAGHSLAEARELAVARPPLIAVVDRGLVEDVTPDALGLPLAPGGALVLFTSSTDLPVALSPTLLRAVLADLRLPLERNRLIALVQHVEDRARATGRGRRNTPDPTARMEP